MKSVIVKATGALGYLFCLLQWLWVTVIFLPTVLKSDFIKQFIQEPAIQEPIVNQSSEISTFGMILAAVIAVVMIILTVYICIKIPTTVGKTGSKITQKTAAKALPIVTRHKKIPQKKRYQLTAQLLFITKITFCVVPFGIILFIDDKNQYLSRDIVMIMAAVLALFSTATFCVQAATAKLLHVSYRQTW